MFSLSKIIGAGLFVAATAAIWCWPKSEPEAAPAEPVRPVRSARVENRSSLPVYTFTGLVRAAESRKLKFKQAGRIERIPVVNGQRVKQGEKLAWLVQSDFINDLEKAQAAADRDRLSYQRISEAGKRNAVSKEEISRSASQLRQSEAQLALARRALEEATLVAPFDGIVAHVKGTELDMVSAASEEVLTVQDMSKLKIDVAVPETVVIIQNRINYRGKAVVRVTFDSCPDVDYPAKFVEYTARADAGTQTYTATYLIDPPGDLMVLPGMSATVRVDGGSCEYKDAPSATVAVPEAAVGVDGQGGYFVWKLEESSEKGVFIARRVPVDGCVPVKGWMGVASGVAVGDRVATAGIAVLTEGRRVTLLGN